MAQSNFDPLLVAAAADLAPLENALTSSFLSTHSYRARFVLGSSGMLARQIRQGAPYDIYLSANEGFVRELVRSGHMAPGSVRVYALGRLALWSKSGRVRSLEDLAARGIRHVAIANPEHAPYGVAAREALKKRDLWDKVSVKLVYGENARQAFQFAQSGNADAVITAWTLVLEQGGVLIPEEWHEPIRQAGGIVAKTRCFEAAEQFLEFLGSPQGQNLLLRYGLFPPKPSDGTGRRRPSGR